MAYTTVTYTFSNSTTADATQVNQNFTDLINGLSDGTKDISVNAITAAGTATLNGNVNLGNSSSDDLTITAALAGSVSVKTNATYNVGSSTLGLLSIYLGATGSYTVRLTPSASQSATYTLTLPTTAGTKGYIPYNSDGSGTLTWEPNQKGVKAASADYTILDNDGFYSILVTTGASDRTITLPAAANNAGRKILIKKVDSGAGDVVISGTVEGGTTWKLQNQYGACTVYSDGSAWYFEKFIYSASSYVIADTPTGHGSTGTKVRKFTSANTTTVGTAITYAADATNGDTFTINENGVYSIRFSDGYSTGTGHIGISRNASATTTNIYSLAQAQQIAFTESYTGLVGQCSVTIRLNSGDIIRAQTSGVNNISATYCQFRIEKISE